MTCPICESKTEVFDSAPDVDAVYRIRRCVTCGYKFCTTETESDDGDILRQLRAENTSRWKMKNRMRGIEKGGKGE